MKLIDKDALVAEIERRNDICKKVALDLRTQENIDYYQGKSEAYKEVAELIDTLEVKGMDLETQIEDYINSHFTEGCDGGMISGWYKVLGGVHYKDLVEIAKHFFELGLKAQKGE